MRTHFDARDVRTLRLLHEYGFTDAELSEHLDLPPFVVRRMRSGLELAPNGVATGIARDRRQARMAAMMHPAQPHLGGQRGAGAAMFRFVDDRHFVEA